MRMSKLRQWAGLMLPPCLTILVVLAALAGCASTPIGGFSCTSDGRAETERVAASVGRVIFGSYEASLAEHAHGCDDGPHGVYDFNGTPAEMSEAVPRIQQAFTCRSSASDEDVLECRAGQTFFTLFVEERISGRLAFTVHRRIG
jgi:hypothetical protein